MSSAFPPAPAHAPAYGRACHHARNPAHALSDTRVMIARGLRRSVRDPEAFITALALPVVLMLLFVYVFGGAFNAGVGAAGGYVNYVVPGLIVPGAGPLGWAGALAMIVAFILAMSWLAACFGLVVSSPEAATGATFALMFVPYLSSAFVPASTMAAGLRPIAANQP